MSFINRVVGMIAKPDDTTKDIAADPRIEEGLLIIGIYTILLIISTYVTLSRIQYTGSFQGIDISMIKTIGLISAIAGAVAVSLIGWPVLTGVVHVLSMFFGASGKFYPNMMTLIGFTAIPLIIATVLAIAIGLVTPVTTFDLTPGAANVTTGMLSSPLSILSMAVTLLSSLWTAYMMAYAVKNGEKLSMGNAWIVVGILLAINLLLTFSSLWMASIKF